MTERSILNIMVLKGIERSEGCPLCFLHLEHERRYMDNLLMNEMTMDPNNQELQGLFTVGIGQQARRT